MAAAEAAVAATTWAEVTEEDLVPGSAAVMEAATITAVVASAVASAVALAVVKATIAFLSVMPASEAEVATEVTATASVAALIAMLG